LPEDLEGVVDAERENATVRFMFSGNVDSLVKALARFQISDLHLEEPTLEEIFLHYYEKEGAR
jgi:ABC-2 type transport system ATP-binding protein